MKWKVDKKEKNINEILFWLICALLIKGIARFLVGIIVLFGWRSGLGGNSIG